MKKLLLLIGLLLMAINSQAAGTTGLSFLTLGNGAQAAGMGDAQTGAAEGVQAVYWNPAGLGLTRNSEMTFSHLQYFQDATQQYGAVAIPLRAGAYGALGVSLNRFAVKDIEERDAQAGKTNSLLEQNDTSLQLSYGFHLMNMGNSTARDGIFVGVGLKSIQEKLANQSESTWAADVGMQYRPGPTVARRVGEWTRRVSMGVAAVNLGKGIKYDTEETPLPRSTRVGLAYTQFVFGDAFNIASDWELGSDGENRWSGGGEFWLKNAIALRAGLVDTQDSGSKARFGAGFRFQFIQFDYAFTAYGDELGDAHRISLSVKFGDAISPDILKEDLVRYYLSQAKESLSVGSYHDAVIQSNNVLKIDPKNSEALQLLLEAGEKMKAPATLPAPATNTDAQDVHP